jgi:hypothetical protein
MASVTGKAMPSQCRNNKTKKQDADAEGILILTE